ncbi:hypothetical protein E4P41_00020 [Geodermatophilus sp. DF01-2]|uniref:hypothetical protein n=1 Tax=Geodermatophilus sp. DF01-2 TaxID=2559610 RepID=UPI0010739233|nr:hypothetical protein [Geodermatophilus sp. DF01_2]TFV64671.1 hypothetical protein E4P41_00020 [Geodermatophilus sp. DF01_2]
MRARRYLRAGLTLDQFFDELNARGVRYAVLRWFETLPDVDPGEDVDILVADEDLDVVGTMLVSHLVAPRRQKFDVYTIWGLPGSDYRGIPYLAPALATGILERAVLLRGRYRVPSPLDHFDSMAYHAVYHKGARSGLPEAVGAVPQLAGAAEHDYAAVLAGLAEQSSLSVPATLRDLDAYLAGKGLRPPLDTLDKLGVSNDWLRRHVDEQFGPADAGIPGLAVFVLRERAAHQLDLLRQELLRQGWEPLETVPLHGDAAARVTAGVRGGNWGRGPWPVGGGPPVAYVVAYDLSASVRADTVTGAPPYDLGRVTATKLRIRRRFLDSMPRGERCNPLHSSDQPRQALDYLALLDDPGVLARARERIGKTTAAMVFPYPVVEVIPSGRRRAVTAVVAHPEFGECICKLFYPSARRFLLRELRARTDFAALPEMPALLAAGDNWLLSERYTDTRAHVRRQLPGVRQIQLTTEASSALAGLAGALNEKGAFLLDLSPFNLLSDPRYGLKVLDWEFLQDYPGEIPPVVESPTVVGHAKGLSGVDVPVGVSAQGESAMTVFHPVVSGLPAWALLSWPARLVPAVAEVGMVLGYLYVGLRTVARKTVRGSGKRLRRRVRFLLVRVGERRSAPRGPSR